MAFFHKSFTGFRVFIFIRATCTPNHSPTPHAMRYGTHSARILTHDHSQVGWVSVGVYWGVGRSSGAVCWSHFRFSPQSKPEALGSCKIKAGNGFRTLQKVGEGVNTPSHASVGIGWDQLGALVGPNGPQPNRGNTDRGRGAKWPMHHIRRP